jgi:hypothetical protein
MSTEARAKEGEVIVNLFLFPILKREQAGLILSLGGFKNNGRKSLGR